VKGIVFVNTTLPLFSEQSREVFYFSGCGFRHEPCFIKAEVDKLWIRIVHDMTKTTFSTLSRKNGRGIEGQQLVLETELLLPASHEVRGAEMIRQPPEQLLEKLRGTVVVCIGKGGSPRRFLYPQVNELSVTAAEAVYDLPERIRSGQMTEEHRDELRLRTESFGVAFSAPFGDQVVKVHCGEKTGNDLTKQT
jgi:hypothetical protein